MMERLVILGGGESGAGAAKLGKKLGYEVFLSDKGKLADKYKRVLEELGVEYEEGQHTEGRIFAADLVVKSPGIPADDRGAEGEGNRGDFRDRICGTAHGCEDVLYHGE